MELQIYKSKKWWALPANICAALLVTLFVTVLAVPLAFTLCPVSQTSMTPTIQDGQYVLLNKYDSEYERGEIVVFNKNGTNLIKRIIAIPGDTIQFVPNEYTASSGRYTGVSYGEVFVYVNGEKLDETYIKEAMEYPFPGARSDSPSKGETLALGKTLTLGDGEYFCMGDNRNGSLDCRAATDNKGLPFGVVKEREIVGTFAYLIPMDSIQELYLRFIYRDFFR